MTRIIPAAACLSLLCWSSFASAIPILEISPSQTEVTVGSTVDATVSIAGLTGEGVGAYDLSLLFDESVLSFADLEYYEFLDDGLGLSFRDFFPSAGQVSVFELSLTFPFNQLGASGFNLFTVTFDVTGVGTSSLGLGDIVIGDLFGIPLEVGVQSASVAAADQVSLPEPSSWMLLALGLLGLTCARRLQSW